MKINETENVCWEWGETILAQTEALGGNTKVSERTRQKGVEYGSLENSLLV